MPLIFIPAFVSKKSTLATLIDLADLSVAAPILFGTLVTQNLIGLATNQNNAALVDSNGWLHLVRFTNGLATAELTPVGHWQDLVDPQLAMAISNSGLLDSTASTYLDGIAACDKVGYWQNLSTIGIGILPVAEVTPDTTSALLLHFDALPFVDSSPNTVALTNNSSVTQTASGKFVGHGSAVFTGSQYLTATLGSLLSTNSDFTVEGFVWVTSGNSNSGVFQISDIGLTTNYPTSVALAFYGDRWRLWGNGDLYSAAGTAAIDTWYHFAVVRYGSTYRLYIDGVLLIDTTAGTMLTGTIAIGGYYSIGFCLTGGSKISEFRVTPSARYTAAFTAPTAAFA